MAVAAPKRRSASQTAAPAPSRTAPPEPKKRPRDRPKPGKPRKVDLTSPAPRKAKAAPARKAPARRKVAPRRRPAGVIPIAAGHAGRAAVAVTQLPESGLIHRLTRGRIWIGVLGLLLVGIVALNVVTLSFAASSGKVDAKNTELGKENSMLQNREAQKYGQERLRHEAAGLGLTLPTNEVPQLIEAKGSDVAEAASRLAAAGAAVSGTTEGAADEGAAGEEGSGEEAVAGEEATSTEAAATGEEGSAAESEFTPEELAIYEREYEELLAAEGVTEVPAE
jgi:hypothetical protein